ncbi:XRE family transcriptional regulator [Tritonibacter mobilis]|nr:XRE family transcriptional regulator [Tritonibacter mobilis]
MSPRLVSSRKYDERATLLLKLRSGEAVVSVQADDRKEAVAFTIASLLEENDSELLDRVCVVTSGNAIIPHSEKRLIIIADVEEGDDPDFGNRSQLTIVRPYPKGRMDVREPLSLSHVPSDKFISELEKMGFSHDEAESKGRKTGYSIPVLRRDLSKDPDVRKPTWARNRTLAKRVLPFALAGSWVERDNIDDRTILELLGDFREGEAETIRDDLLALNDAPITRYGYVNVVVSQIDALFAVGQYIDRGDLDRFFQLLPELLGERDPALDLPQDQWYMASVLGRSRSFSGALLSGLGDALCILSVYGAEICGDRLVADLSYRAAQVVRSLMQGADEERWLSIRGHLRALAEASPSAFLDCLEAELLEPEPAIRAIMGTTEGVVSGECLRTNLLWALELLAWNPDHFSRVVEIVFDLRRLEVKDNWSNSPKSTARSLFLAWLPATTLGADQKMSILRRLSARYRHPVMDVCVSLLPRNGMNAASRTARPKWRVLDAEVPTPTISDVRMAEVEASRILLDMAPFQKSELERLLDVATCLCSDDLSRLVIEVENWSQAATDEDKAELRHNLRQCDVHRVFQEVDEDEQLSSAFRRMEKALLPQSPTARHRWLFENSFVEWRALLDDEESGRLSWQERDKRVKERRREAVADIREQLGEDTILPFALSVKHPELVAEVLVSQDAAVPMATYWVSAALQSETNDRSSAFLGQLLWSAGRIDLAAVVAGLEAQGALNCEAERLRFAEHLPGHSIGWNVAESLGEDAASAFWNSVSIRIYDDTPLDEMEYAAKKLLRHQRPKSAFSTFCLFVDKLSAARWVEILQAVVRGEEPNGPSLNSHALGEVFQLLDAEEAISDDQIAYLELPFVRILRTHGSERHKRTLAIHRQLACDPQYFVEMLCWRYPRSDGSDQVELEEHSVERQKFFEDLAYHTLEGWGKVPGCDDDGVMCPDDFIAWTDTAFRLAVDAGRNELAEIHFSALLAKMARSRPWANWLPNVVLDYLDRSEHAGLREYFCVGVRNARGMTCRYPYDGGAQERKLAGRYRELATRYGSSHPRLSESLKSIAEGYEWDARREDERAAVGERWHP